MARKATNKFLTKAKKSKSDEFYTVLSDIEKELRHYKRHFKNKVVYCNPDDPHVSNFFHYFSYNFEKLRLKKLITTCYKNQNADLFSRHDTEKAIYLEYEGDKNKNNFPDPMEDDDIGDKKGIYTYVLTRKEKHLNIRAFSPNQKREAYERQKGICRLCRDKKRWDITEMEADHIKPWHEGGKTDAKNCQMLCKQCNRTKSGK